VRGRVLAVAKDQVKNRLRQVDSSLANILQCQLLTVLRTHNIDNCDTGKYESAFNQIG
jgi:hypothetical protein